MQSDVQAALHGLGVWVKEVETGLHLLQVVIGE